MASKSALRTRLICKHNCHESTFVLIRPLFCIPSCDTVGIHRCATKNTSGSAAANTMRRQTTYEQTLERLKTQGTREQECFWRAVTALRGKGTAAEFSATITDARAAIDKLVQDPELFT